MIVDFYITNYLIVTNTIFGHKIIHRTTREMKICNGKPIINPVLVIRLRINRLQRK